MKMADVLAGDAGLAGVQWVLCSGPVHAAMRNTLRTLLADPVRLGACRLQRAKFKPGRKLTAYYDVSILNRDGAQDAIRPIAVTWTLRESAAQAGEESDQLALMQAEALQRGMAAPFCQLAASVPKWQMRIQIAPLDVRFPQLVRASDPRYVHEILTAACNTAAGPYTVTPIRYRPGQRHVLRYAPVATPGPVDGCGAMFAKLYSGNQGLHAFHAVNWGADQLAKGATGVSALRPRAYIADENIILYPSLAGAPLTNLLRRPQRTTARCLWLAGRALRTLHDAPASLANGLPRRDFASEVKATAQAGEHIHALLPAVGAQFKTILSQVQSHYERLPQESPTFTHSDFKADHLWVTQSGLTLIDFDSCALADPARDVGKFLADLHWWHAIYQQPGLVQAQAHFLAGYGLDATDTRLIRARLYETLVLTKIAAHRLRIFDRTWSLHIAQIIHRAAAVLEGTFQQIVNCE